MILTSRGFADLIERVDFYKRVAKQNGEILDEVTAVRQELEALRQRSEPVYLRNDEGRGFGGDF